MIYINKHQEPGYLVEYRKKHPGDTYDSNDFEALKHTLRFDLIKEQKGLCAYCCCRITEESCHNEHIEPRHRKDGTISVRSLDYDNMVASCNNATCGNHKGNEYDPERFVSPLNVKCEEKFSYDPDGFIKGDEYTINLLDLNSYRLRRARSAVYRSVMNLSGDVIESIYFDDEDTLFPYSNVIKWVMRGNEK